MAAVYRFMDLVDYDWVGPLEIKDTYVFLHNMRTAGTSTREYLKRYQVGEEFLFHHTSLSAIRKFGVKYKTVTTLRNPFAREVSLYKFYKRNAESFANLYDSETGMLLDGSERVVDITLRAALEMDFDDFLKYRYDIRFDYDGSAAAQFPQGLGQVANIQSSYLYHVDGPPDFIFQFEKIGEQLPNFLEQHGLTAGDFPHANATEPSDYRDYYSQTTIDLVAQHEQQVLAKFNYIF